MTPVDAFLARCGFGRDCLLQSLAGSTWRVGTVGLLRSAGHLLLVRKAQSGPDNYAFRGMWAMPGGMIRKQPTGSTVGEAALASLRSRVALEAGLAPEQMHDGGHSETLGPIVTSYARHDRVWHTLITVRQFSVPERPALASDDPSVEDARWVKVPPDWMSLSPANRLALAHLLWRELSGDERKEAMPALREALDWCNGWAAEVNVTRAPAPWEEPERLADWRAGFPD